MYAASRKNEAEASVIKQKESNKDGTMGVCDANVCNNP